MKKFILIVMLFLMLFTLCGCTDYPYVRVFRTVYREDNFNIQIPPNLALDESMPYRFDYDANTLTIYFVKENP